MMNAIIAMMKRLFVLNRSVRYAVIGIMMALTSVNAVVSHCALDASMLRSDMMEGSAGVTSVWFKMVMNEPETKTSSITTCFFVNPSMQRSFPHECEMRD